MKRYAFVGAIALAFLIGAITAAPAYAAPASRFKGMFETFAKEGKILEIRFLADSSYDIIYLTKEGKIRMLKIKENDSVEQTTLRKYNMEKIKALAGGADKAFDTISSDPAFAKKMPFIFSIGLREAKSGDLEFALGAYSGVGVFKRMWIVYAKTWTVNPKAEEKIPNPRDEAWSVEEKAAGNNDYPKALIGKGAVTKEGQAQGATMESSGKQEAQGAAMAPAGKQDAPAATKAKAKGKGKGKGKKKQANQGEGEQ